MKLQLEELETRDCPSVASSPTPVVTYGGGLLLPNVVVHPVFYGSGWLDGGQNQLTGFYLACDTDDIVNSPYMDVLTQAGYGVGRGKAGATEVLNAPLNGRGWLDDSTIQSELLPLTRGAAPNELWVVFVEPSVAVTFQRGLTNSQKDFYGYHFAFGDYDPSQGSVIRPYCVVPWGGPVDGSPFPNLGAGDPFDTATELMSHELAEAVTDPLANGWREVINVLTSLEIADLGHGVSYVLDGYLVVVVVDQDGNPIYPNGYGMLS